jgi:hypothetical protein
MGDGLVPSKDELLSPSYAKSADKSDIWRNFFENPTTVQFDHRVLVRGMYITLTNASQHAHLGYDHIHCYRRLIRSDISSSSQAGTTRRHAKISTRIIRCCQPTSRTGHHHSPLPCPSTPCSRSSGGECRLTHSRTRVDGKPAKAVGCRASIEASSQTPSYSIYPSHGEELTVCNSSLSLFSPLNGISMSRPSPGNSALDRCLRTHFRGNCKPKSLFLLQYRMI